MEYKGYLGKIELDEGDGVFHGEVLNTKDVITFRGRTVDEVTTAFKDSIDDYLEFCKEIGEEPDKPFSGKFIVRLDPELHRKIWMQANLDNTSLNNWVTETLETVISDIEWHQNKSTWRKSEMDVKQKAKALIEYLQNLSDFTIVEREPYDHMGAIIVDTMLQAGAKYDAVRERRDMVKSYEEAKTTSGFLSLLNRQKSVNSFLDWDGRKPQWVLNMARFLQDEKVETTSNLQQWLQNTSNQEKLLTQKGIGAKTKDYLIKLAGLQSIPIDRHWYRCLDYAKVSYTGYSDAQNIVELAADIWGKDKSSLDTSVWRYFREFKESKCY